ncbi:hypothetical protein AAG906_022367 [Vitis piasezkii]
MACMTMAISSQSLNFNRFFVRCCHDHVISCQNTTSISFPHRQQDLCGRLSYPCNLHQGSLRFLSKPISAVGSGSKASIIDPKDNDITIKNAKIVVESQEDDEIQSGRGRVDTQRVFDHVLTNLARSAPPIPGFRRQKGGKTSNILFVFWFSTGPKEFSSTNPGEERVTKFVIQEIITATVSDYVMKENLNVKDKKITTTPAAEELKSLFTPGNEFGFNATLELEKSESEATSSSSSEME